MQDADFSNLPAPIIIGFVIFFAATAVYSIRNLRLVRQKHLESRRNQNREASDSETTNPVLIARRPRKKNKNNARSR